MVLTISFFKPCWHSFLNQFKIFLLRPYSHLKMGVFEPSYSHAFYSSFSHFKLWGYLPKSSHYTFVKSFTYTIHLYHRLYCYQYILFYFPLGPSLSSFCSFLVSYFEVFLSMFYLWSYRYCRILSLNRWESSLDLEEALPF
jgi:hypothetical protein